MAFVVRFPGVVEERHLLGVICEGRLDNSSKTIFTVIHHNFSLCKRQRPREMCRETLPILAVFNGDVRHCDGDNLSVPINGRGEQQQLPHGALT